MNINTALLKTFGLSFALVAVTYDTHAIEKNAVTDDDAKIQTVAIESEPGLQPFIDRYIAAVNARDSQAIKAMTHPNDLKALIKFLAHKPADYKNDTLKSMLLCDKPVPKNHTPFIVKHYLPGSSPPEDGLLIWTIRPTHTVEFTYEKSPRNEVWVFINLVRENDHWFLVGGVPDQMSLRISTNAVQGSFSRLRHGRAKHPTKRMPECKGFDTLFLGSQKLEKNRQSP